MKTILHQSAAGHASAKTPIRKGALAVAAAAVAAFAVFAAARPGFAQERELVCTIAEHTHDDSCQGGLRLVCTLAENDEHTHSDACYEEVAPCVLEEHVHTDACYADAAADDEVTAPTPVCGQQEHAHDAACRDEAGVLVCGLEEHAHTDACYTAPEADVDPAPEAGSETEPEADDADAPAEPPAAEPVCGLEEHTHTDACYDEAGALICGLEEHAHTESCYPAAEPETAETPTLYCGLEEHVHGPECFDENGEPICGKIVHIHSEDCYAVPQKSYETMLEDGLTIVISGPVTAFPTPVNAADLTASATELLPGDEDYETAKALVNSQNEEGENIISQRLFNICLMDGETEVQPLEPVVVSFLNAEQPEGTQNDVFHCNVNDGTVEDMGAATDAEGTVSFDTPHFSYWGWNAIGSAAVNSEAQLRTALQNGSTPITLTGSFNVANALTVSKATTLNLNGCTITYTGSGSLFTVSGGVTFTVYDKQETFTESDPIAHEDMEDFLNRNAYLKSTELNSEIYSDQRRNNVDTWLSNYDDSSKVLTYYKVVPVPQVVTTKDRRDTYQVDMSSMGALQSSNGAHLITLNNNSILNIKSGRITNKKGQAIYSTANCTVNIMGGYLVGSGVSSTDRKTGCEGGAIYMAKGTLNVSGGVLAANKARNGGAIFMGTTVKTGGKADPGGTVTITGNAVISGNEATGQNAQYAYSNTGSGSTKTKEQDRGDGGGGLYLNRSKLTIFGGYITNNYSSGREHPKITKNTTQAQLNVGYSQMGGGGVLLTGYQTSANQLMLTMSGGYVTGNISEQSAGGIFLRTNFIYQGMSFSMTGGSISSNTAVFHEAGGLFVDQYVYGTIQASDTDKVYITNNRSLTYADWGGGGMFVAGFGTMRINNALITGNDAGGFGGGLGGCSTGKLDIAPQSPNVNADGAAIFDNTAAGQNTTIPESGGKTQDQPAKRSEVFTKDGYYTDFFCANSSRVSSMMLGGGSANWKGTLDYIPVELKNKGTVGTVETAGKMAGLRAFPLQSAKDAAIQNANVFISGNYSRMHGGGIMCNGVITFTTAKNLEFPTGFSVLAHKKLEGEGTQLHGDDFTFELYDGSKAPTWNKDHVECGGKLLATTTNGSGGIVQYGDSIADTNWHTYYLIEKYDANKPVTQWSNVAYKITLKAGSTSWTWNDINFITYSIDDSDVTVYKITFDRTKGTPSGDRTPISYTWDDSINQIELRGNNFVNTGKKVPFLSLLKQSTDKTAMKGVQFALYSSTLADATPLQTLTSDFNGAVKTFTLENSKTYYLCELPNTENAGYWLAGPWVVTVDDASNVKMYDAIIQSDGSWTYDSAKPLTLETKTLSTNEHGIDHYELKCYVISNTPTKDLFELPGTGGIGTTVFYLGGGALVLIAAALLLKKRRHLSR